MKKVTLRDIASELGISIGTVDRAVHNRPGVNPDTRARVLALIDKYEYHPDPIARSLSMRTRPVRIGVIFPESPRFFWDRVADGVSAAATDLADLNTEVRVCRVADRYSSFARAADELLAGGVDAVALVPREHPAIRGAVQRIRDAGVPFSTLNDDLDGCGRLFYIGPQLAQSGRVAGELMGRFLPQGGRVLLIADAMKSEEYGARITGFREKLSDDYPMLRLLATLTVDSGLADTACEALLTRALAEYGRPDGIYDATTFLLPTIARRKRVLPELQDVLLIGHEISALTEGMLRENLITACISQDPYSQGYMSVRYLHRYLSTGALPEHERMYARLDILTKENLIVSGQSLDNYIRRT